MGTPVVALNTLNFFMADVRDGLGPFLGVYLQSQSWTPAEIGAVMTFGGLAGVIAAAPAGVLIDLVTRKRAVLAGAALAIVASSMAMLLKPTFIVTAVSQLAGGVAAAFVAPAIAAITLGLVRQSGYARQLGHNEAFNHAGNVVAAILAGGLGYVLGIGAVFAVMIGMAAASIIAIVFIDPRAIDHFAARGSERGETAPPVSLFTLLSKKPLLIVALTLTLFHLGNAAMLPLLGQAVVARGLGDPSATTGATIVIAQLTMIVTALIASAVAARRGYWPVFLFALLSLPLRSLVAASMPGGMTALIPVQILDGVGAGLLGVATPGFVARILDGTGHVNAGLGGVMMMQAIGASLSPAIGGFVAEQFGYDAAFVVLGVFALVALVLWLATHSMMRSACATPQAACEGVA
jgi:MFS family permease